MGGSAGAMAVATAETLSLVLERAPKGVVFIMGDKDCRRELICGRVAEFYNYTYINFGQIAQQSAPSNNPDESLMSLRSLISSCKCDRIIMSDSIHLSRILSSHS